MKILRYLFLFGLLVGCSSQKPVAKSEAKATAHRVYQYKNKLVRTTTEPVLSAALPVDSNKSNGFSPPEIANQHAKAEVVAVESKVPQRTQIKGYKPTSALPEQSKNTDIEEYKRATKAGGTGLLLSMLGILMLALASLGGNPIVFGLGAVLLLGGLIFSLKGLKGGKRNQAIAGLIISGLPILTGLVALVFYLVRR